MHAYTVSLEAKLKEPIPTPCSTCELHALKNLQLAHYVTSLILLVCKNVEFQKLDLNLSAYEIIKDVFLYPFPKVLGF
jgi:hypothetical protein